MAQRIALDVSLAQELAGYGRAEIAPGGYGSTGEVIRSSPRRVVRSGADRTAGPRTVAKTRDA